MSHFHVEVFHQAVRPFMSSIISLRKPDWELLQLAIYLSVK